MKFPWERSDEKKASDLLSTEFVKARLDQVMNELRDTLDEIERTIQEDTRSGGR